MPGGGSGGGSTTSTTQTNSEPWEAQQPYLKQIFSEAQNLYGSSAPEFFPGSTQVPISGETEAGLQMGTQRATEGSPLNAAAQSGVMDTLGGKYLGQGNPYLQSVMKSVGDQAAGGVNSMFARGGRYGSGINSQLAARGAAQAMAPFAFGAYENERGRMGEAQQMAPQLAREDYFDIGQMGQIGQTREGYSQGLLNEDISRFNFGQNVQSAKLADYSGLLSGNYGGNVSSIGSQTQDSGGGGFQNILGAGIGLASFFGGCWVAREVYGEDDPRWREFRWWLTNFGPRWLFKFYWKHGSKFARVVRRHPVLKLVLRPLMDLARFSLRKRLRHGIA